MPPASLPHTSPCISFCQRLVVQEQRWCKSRGGARAEFTALAPARPTSRCWLTEWGSPDLPACAHANQLHAHSRVCALRSHSLGISERASARASFAVLLPRRNAGRAAAPCHAYLVPACYSPPCRLRTSSSRFLPCRFCPQSLVAAGPGQRQGQGQGPGKRARLKVRK